MSMESSPARQQGDHVPPYFLQKPEMMFCVHNRFEEPLRSFSQLGSFFIEFERDACKLVAYVLVSKNRFFHKLRGSRAIADARLGSGKPQGGKSKIDVRLQKCDAHTLGPPLIRRVRSERGHVSWTPQRP
jgi:hypothetical protein